MMHLDEENYIKAVAIIREDGARANTSYLQRRMQVGYNNAARLIDRMETEGVVSEANHLGQRTVITKGTTS